MIFFRPFLGEILVGKIISANEKGIWVSIGFFEDIFVPSYLLQTPSEYKKQYSHWVWKYDGESADSEFVFSIGSMMRVKVRTINFTKLQQTAKGVESTTISAFQSHESNANQSQGAGDNNAPVLLRHRSSSLSLDDVPGSAPMQIIAAANEDGLGLVEWWT